MSRLRQAGIRLEQEPFLAVRSLAANFHNGYVIERHTHPWHQLIGAGTGAITVFAGRWSWIVPAGRAVLIPAGVVHSIRMWGNVAAQSLYFSPPLLTAGDCLVLSVTPLLAALISRVIDLAALDSRLPSHQALLKVLLDELDSPGELHLGLPLPMDPRALALARRILTAPAADEDPAVLAHGTGASRRTLERLFVAETGLSLGMWRQKARLLGAIRLLAAGNSVTTTALDTGYSSVSAFIAAFRKTFGYTPGNRLGRPPSLSQRVTRADPPVRDSRPDPSP